MNRPPRMNAESRRPFFGYLWGVLAALTCPCHLLVLTVVLAGTGVGAFIDEHWVIAAVAMTGLFVIFLARAQRAFRAYPYTQHERHKVTCCF